MLYLTSPPPVHREQALDALSAGCALLIEKPVALDMADVQAVGEAAQRAGKLVLVCQQHRYSQAALRARELLAGRKVGLFHSYLYRQRPDIRGNWQRSWGGGHVVENQIHPIDLARYLIGEVRSVYARYAEHVLAGTEDWDNWDSYSVTLEFEGGAVGSVATTYAAFPRIPQSSAVDIVAEGLVLRYHWGRLEVFYPDREPETVPVEEDPTIAIGRAFLHAVESGEQAHLRAGLRRRRPEPGRLPEGQRVGQHRPGDPLPLRSTG